MALLQVQPLPLWPRPLHQTLVYHLSRASREVLQKELNKLHTQYASNPYRANLWGMEVLSQHAYKWIGRSFVQRFHKILVPLLQAQHQTWSTDLCEALCLHGSQLDLNTCLQLPEEADQIERPYTIWLTQVLRYVTSLYTTVIPRQCWAHGSIFFFEGVSAPLQDPENGLWYWGWTYRTSRTEGYFITRMCYTKALTGNNCCFLFAFTAQTWKLLSVVHCPLSKMATITFPGTRFAQLPTLFWNLVPLSEALQDGRETIVSEEEEEEEE